MGYFGGVLVEESPNLEWNAVTMADAAGWI